MVDCHTFIGSMLAAIAAASAWVAYSDEVAAVPAGELNLMAMMGVMGAYLLVLYVRRDNSQLLVTGLVMLGVAAVSALLFLQTRSLALQDRRVMPVVVRVSFGVFVVALVITGGALVLRAEHVFPWPLRDDTSVMFGTIFLADALFFLYGVLRPMWANAVSQLFAFLAYDLVLIVPFLRHFGTVADAHRLSLIIYTVILLYSSGLAIYFLLLHRATRLPVLQPEGASVATGAP